METPKEAKKIASHHIYLLFFFFSTGLQFCRYFQLMSRAWLQRTLGNVVFYSIQAKGGWNGNWKGHSNVSINGGWMFGLIWSEAWGQSYGRPWQAKICTSQSYSRGSRGDVQNQRKLDGERAREWKITEWNREVELLGQAPGEWSWPWLSMRSGWALYLPFNTWGIGRYDLFLPFPLPPHLPLPDASVFSVLPFPKLGQGPHSLLPWHRVQCWHKVMIS